MPPSYTRCPYCKGLVPVEQYMKARRCPLCGGNLVARSKKLAFRFYLAFGSFALAMLWLNFYPRHPEQLADVRTWTIGLIAFGALWKVIDQLLVKVLNIEGRFIGMYLALVAVLLLMAVL